MKSILLLLLITIGSCRAATDYEREFKQLSDDREKALKAASEPINRRYQTGLEALLKKATQGGDLETALKIRNSLDGLTGAKVKKPAATNPREFVGTWELRSKAYRGERVLKPDGSVSGSPLGAASWTVEAGELKIVYGERFIDAFQLPGDGNRLVGTNTQGAEVTLTKLK